ncbi:MAG TPA: sigma 54-interacting transcriptional regulator [Methylococcaceae bacterium]|jgi:DNA-binding NtrC family response regulator|nr:sigma 54-interacting transcriptional regulator [Methylococcaceae bacterium]
MELRKLLCFHQLPSEHLEMLRSLDWDIHSAANLEEVQNLIKAYPFNIGLAFIDNGSQATLSELLGLFSIHHYMEWVALLPPEVMERQDICQLITRFFYDYHTLPVDPYRLQITLGHAYGMANIMRTVRFQVESMVGQEMVGSSPRMMSLFGDIRKVAMVDAPVLITGESGTGKEMAALAVHQRSCRANHPFIAVNCGALPASLVQSELFGYEKGAFTGANQSKIGRIEAAAGGTLFLDEIGDLPLEMQVNLLRFFQEKTIQRVGSNKEILVDVRIIAATHVDLEKAVTEGHFREDLYYRLNVLNVKMPPLRERREDIELLARYYFDRFSNEKGRHVKGFTSEALNAMRYHDWPGNVRELINRIRRAMVMSENNLVSAADLGLTPVKTSATPACNPIVSLDEAKALAEKEAIQNALNLTENNVSRAARELRVSRMTLYRLMEKYHINAA